MSESILDLITASDKDKISQSGVLDIGLTDHVIVKSNINKHNIVLFRSMRKHSKELFCKIS